MHRLLYRQGRTLEEAKGLIEQLATEKVEAQADIDMMLGFLNQATRGIVR
jgi:UDP-N-acetylglucosamine acyltransferase